jgi:tripartite-type tricarboxylate transporter receptor subunit TctC
MRKALGIGVLLLVALCGATLAQAAWAPVRPVEIVAPAGPGGGWDLLARTMQKVLTEEKIVNVPIVVTNKPAAAARPDGPTSRARRGRESSSP